MLLMTNATLGFIEEMNAQASIAALKDGLVRKLPIKRDGTFVPMDIAELVPGDIVFLRGGNVVPADGMWVEGDELSVDQVRVWMRMLCVCRRMLCVWMLLATQSGVRVQQQPPPSMQPRSS